jgi:hypothetical protein
MAPPSNDQLVRRYAEAVAAQDDDALGLLRLPGWTAEWPQTAERVRGHANDRAILDNWPGGRPSAQVDRFVGAEDRWVVTPSFTVQRVVGSGDFWWATGQVVYPDGSTWFFVVLLELRESKVLREIWYTAPPSEAPAWRAQWVERLA